MQNNFNLQKVEYQAYNINQDDDVVNIYDNRKKLSMNYMKPIKKEISFEEKISRVNNNYFNSKYFKV